ncbi:cytidylyltransferase domain-containing protein [Parvicella tangerina]|uniref:8-amino-3,8-dideoxy-manno-octulosonate cytidylyltransferase n=1 Tax=Parvicella tangerina TaxID=2829795 RepID=A0A916JL09_9FLAO|nr:hypothetical protein [Parvicella tangerina]CAG5079735.1 8-amino-3,8-dideoxy-manno-octulosonate cytidylyltransferase [Parvicella tangerina]
MEITRLNKTAIIVQARLGSTRLPGKMERKFDASRSLLEVVISQLKKTRLPIIIATSTNKENDWVASIARQNECLVYRGYENDVLQRFIDAAKEFKIERIIRVCADNPFILPEQLRQLAEELNRSDDDYVAFAFKDGLPTIKSHIGLFGEGCTLKGLEAIKRQTNEPFYCEHVTNFFYDNPKGFCIRFLTLPSQLEQRQDVRLTIDTKEDFEMSSKLYQMLSKQGKLDDIDALIKEVDENPVYLQIMKNEITRNSK